MTRSFDEFIDFAHDYAAVNRIPLNGTFELTARCNLHCRMCFVCNPKQAAGAELSGKQWLEIMGQARDAGMAFAMLTGGEAMLHRDFWDIYLGLRKLGVYITLNSNGTTITPEVVDLLKKNPPLRIAISLYGSSPEAYQKATGSAAGFKQAIRGVELLRDRGLDFRLRTILTRDTAEDMINLVRLILSYDVPFSYGNYILPPIMDNGNDPCSLRLNTDELIKYSAIIENEIADYYRKHGNPREHIQAEMREEAMARKSRPADAEREDLHMRAEAARKATLFRCQAGLSRFSVTYDGLIRLCEVSRNPAFDLKGMSFMEGFKRLGEAADMIPDCVECVGCADKKSCAPCPPRHFIETGSYMKKADYVCAYTRAGIKLLE